MYYLRMLVGVGSNNIRMNKVVFQIIRPYANDATKPVRKIKRIPVAMDNLISNAQSIRNNAWPLPEHIIGLSMYFSEANITIPEFEAYIKMYGRNAKEGQPKNQFFESNNLFEKWKHDPSEVNLIQFLMDFENNVLGQQDQIGVTKKRAEYICSVWRLLHIYESALATTSLQSTSKLVADFSQRCKTQFKMKDIDLYLMLANLQFQQDGFLPQIEDQISLARLIRSMSIFSDINNTTLSLNFPRCLQLVDLEPLFSHFGQNTDLIPSVRISFLLSLSKAEWEKGNFSSSLSNLSKSSLLFLQNLNPEIYKSDEWEDICACFCQVWWHISNSATSKNMEPALDYLLTECKYFQSTFPALGFLPSYILLLSAEVNENPGTIARIRLDDSIRDPEFFERAFSSQKMVVKHKKYMMNYYIKNALETFEKNGNIKSSETKSLSDNSASFSNQGQDLSQSEASTDTFNETNIENTTNTDVESSEHNSDMEEGLTLDLKRELLDVKLLQMLVTKDNRQIVNIYLSHIKNGVCPTDEVLKALVDFFSNSEDIDSMDLLFKATPSIFEARDNFYLEMNQVQLRKIIEKWQNNDVLDAWIEAVELYRSIWGHSKSCLTSKNASDTIIRKVRQFCKLIIEDNLRREKQFLPAFKSGSLMLASEYNDVYLLLTYWEALFFSTKYDHQLLADQLIEEIPQLVSAMSIDSVITRANSYDKEDIFRKIIELILRNNGSDYNKSRSFEALLGYLIKHRRVQAGEVTIRTAKSMNIRITTDYQIDFLKLKKESTSTLTGVFNSISRMLYKKPDQ